MEKYSYRTDAFERKKTTLVRWLIERFDIDDKLFIVGREHGYRIIFAQEDVERRLERLHGAKYWERSITEARAYENRIREDLEGRMNIWLRQYREVEHAKMVRHIQRLRRQDLRDAYLPLPSIWRP